MDVIEKFSVSRERIIDRKHIFSFDRKGGVVHIFVVLVSIDSTKIKVAIGFAEPR